MWRVLKILLLMASLGAGIVVFIFGCAAYRFIEIRSNFRFVFITQWPGSTYILIVRDDSKYQPHYHWDSSYNWTHASIGSALSSEVLDQGVKWHFLGEFAFKRNGTIRSLPTVFPNTVASAIEMPTWVTFTISLLLIVPGATWIIRSIFRFFRKLRRTKEGLCKKCSYDLRATPDRCPECGEILKK